MATKHSTRARVGSGAPSLCWVCLKQLQRAPGRGMGLFYFQLVKDRAGVEHRVHGDCVRFAEEDGAKLVPNNEPGKPPAGSRAAH